MTGKTHMAAGLLAGQLLAIYAGGYPTISAEYGAIVGVAALGSLLPDIDHRKSKISQSNIATKTASVAVNMAFKHRGLTHTPFFILLAYIGLTGLILLSGIGPFYMLLNKAFALGMISHIFLDMLNKEGIMPIYPISKKRFSLAPLHTGGIVDILLTVVLTLANIVILMPTEYIRNYLGGVI